MIKIRQGLDLPILGAPSSEVADKSVRKVAVTGFDYIGMKPTMLVKEGDTVKIGQPVFSCKKNIGLIFTAPAAGKVTAINRGEKRVFQSLEIEVAGNEDHHSFKTFLNRDVESYSFEELRALLIESGAWTHLRQRPFDKVADVNARPASVFVTAMDSNPLCMDPDVVISKRLDDFHRGLKAVAMLTEGKTYVCQRDDHDWNLPSVVDKKEFWGIHPAGNVGTHMHFIDPPHANRISWHIGYQDVIAIGHLLETGKLDTERVVALGGPYANNPRILRTRRGACMTEVLSGEIKDGARVISGSVFHGRKSEPGFCFLGHYANQISVIEEDEKRELLGWHSPGPDKFSVKNIYISKLIPGKKFAFGSNTNGSLRAMVPIGSYEKVTPLDILPTQLLRAICSKDTDTAQDLGVLELAEEDLALYTFVDNGKIDFGSILRENLTTIEKEG